MDTTIDEANEPITEESIRQIAHLSRIDISEEELGRTTGEFQKLLSYVQILKECDNETQANRLSAEASGAEDLTGLRADVEGGPTDRLDSQALSRIAPAFESDCFKVPKVISSD